MSEARTAAPASVDAAPAPGPRVPLGNAVAAVAAGQLGRVRVARGPLLLVATLQSLGLVVLLRGVVHQHDPMTAGAIVAGSTVLVVAFVSLNLLAQRLGALRATTALDYYAALPIPPAAVILGMAAAYAAFTLPGAIITALVGAAVYGLPFGQIWLVVPVVLAAAVVLAGAGAILGLSMPRPELATIAGQLGMTVVLFLGIIAPSRLPDALQALRDIVPGTLAVDALVDSFRVHPHWGGIVVRLVITVGYGVVTLAVASRLFRRAVDR